MSVSTLGLLRNLTTPFGRGGISAAPILPAVMVQGWNTAKDEPKNKTTGREAERGCAVQAARIRGE
jgi:hypothetical protein